MQLNRSLRQIGRSKTGYQITELGPALIILFLFIFFPIMNLFYIGFAYADGWFLNQLLAREVSCTPPIQPIATGTGYELSTPYSASSPGPSFPSAGGSDLDTQVQAKLDAYKSSGLWKFLGNATTSSWIYQHVTPQPNAPPAPPTPPNIVDYCIVTTLMTIPPFLPVSIGSLPIPGINVPIQFRFSTQLLQEEKGLN